MQTFGARHPLPVCLHLLLTVGVAMFSFQPMLLLLACLGGTAYVCLLWQDGMRGWHMGRMAAFLFLCAVGLNLITNQRGQTVFLVWNDHPMTLEALRFGVVAGMMLVAALLWFRVFSFLLTSDRLLYLLRLLSPSLALLVSMTLRTLPLLQHQRQRILAAQTTLCLPSQTASTRTDRLRRRLRVEAGMLTWGLEHGMETADSMTARGYGIGKRSQYTRFVWRAADVRLLLWTLGCTAVLCWGGVKQVFATAYYPVYQPPQRTTAYLVCLVAYGCMTFCPIFIDAKERARWQFYQSSI